MPKKEPTREDMMNQFMRSVPLEDVRRETAPQDPAPVPKQAYTPSVVPAVPEQKTPKRKNTTISISVSTLEKAKGVTYIRRESLSGIIESFLNEYVGKYAKEFAEFDALPEEKKQQVYSHKGNR